MAMGGMESTASMESTEDTARMARQTNWNSKAEKLT